ncbi:4'-phosphopantetheinyl transferase family protein [Occultella gossypii]|uniref:4'-phosphopantetheinyl transferase superfamily protein n=1 Tax=Occultella gossypii TaxID=2800820 RepID=A0ABS7SCS5_9MICO|nr:4'-phosphopantetheinyl transferase superfamily protein [Occultella gossypii]MBZ2198166.1 4'-phosphopantetheinyl transferase superfamily protein [Occultella gossypii]
MVRLRHGTVTLWWAPYDVADPTWLDLLDPVEARRYAAYRRSADRARFLVGAVAVRQIFANDLAIASHRVPLDRTCPNCGRPHGKVRLADDLRQPGETLEVSVSHSGTWVVVAAGRDGPVGVDVEAVDPSLDHVGLARVALGDRDSDALLRLGDADRAWAFTRMWVRREAAVKAASPVLPVGSPRLQLHDVVVDANHRAAVAVVDSPPVDVVGLDASSILPPPGAHS